MSDALSKPHAAAITGAAIYCHFQSKRNVLEAVVDERAIVVGLQQPERAGP
jgi:AcrR family transcriptional regulator